MEYQNIHQMRERLVQLNNEAKHLCELIESLEKECKHQWGEPESDPYNEFTPFQGFLTTMPTIRTSRWKRTCLHCGKVQYTYKSQPTHYEPIFDDDNPQVATIR
jgi:hypothetical protein